MCWWLQNNRKKDKKFLIVAQEKKHCFVCACFSPSDIDTTYIHSSTHIHTIPQRARVLFCYSFPRFCWQVCPLYHTSAHAHWQVYCERRKEATNIFKPQCKLASLCIRVLFFQFFGKMKQFRAKLIKTNFKEHEIPFLLE